MLLQGFGDCCSFWLRFNALFVEARGCHRTELQDHCFRPLWPKHAREEAHPSRRQQHSTSRHPAITASLLPNLAPLKSIFTMPSTWQSSRTCWLLVKVGRLTCRICQAGGQSGCQQATRVAAETATVAEEVDVAITRSRSVVTVLFEDVSYRNSLCNHRRADPAVRRRGREGGCPLRAVSPTFLSEGAPPSLFQVFRHRGGRLLSR